MIRTYILKQNEAFKAIAYVNGEGSHYGEAGTVYQVVIEVQGYWGSGMRIDPERHGPCRLGYSSGGYESNPEKFKVALRERMNIQRAENFANAMLYASQLMYKIDERRKVDNLDPLGIHYEEEVTES